LVDGIEYASPRRTALAQRVYVVSFDSWICAGGFAEARLGGNAALATIDAIVASEVLERRLSFIPAADLSR
jgi:hypothetical protein